MRILIVEDDLEAAEAMDRGLTETGHACTRAPDGEEGLAAARGGEFDVMIVDRMMPKMDGVTLIETIRRRATRRRSCSSPRWARSVTASRACRPAATTIW